MVPAWLTLHAFLFAERKNEKDERQYEREVHTTVRRLA